MSERKKTKKPAKPTPARSKAPAKAKAPAPVKRKGPQAAPDSPMNVDLLQQLVGLMSAHELNNVELRDGDRRIILSRGAQQQLVSYAAPVAAAPAAVHAAPAASAPATAASAPAAPAASAAADDSNLIPIKSPMVGTYYSRPSPDAPAFVSAGTTVDEESDVCIIEAMKVFNNIKAEVRGTIARVLVEDRQAVEFGTVLFLVKPA